MSKAVFIDGASLNYMLKALGVGRLDFKLFHNFLKSRVGTVQEFISNHLITVNPGQASGFIHALRVNGFEPLSVGSENSRDDRALLERIKLVDPKVVREIVIVTSDRDFAPDLLSKVELGIAVYWVGTRAVNGNGRSAMSPELEPLFTNGRFTFIELGDYVNEISLREIMPRRKAADGMINISLEIPEESVSSSELLFAVGELAQRFPGLRYNVKN